MENTVHNGDIVLLLKKTQPKDGDIIVIKMDDKTSIIKRVIGVSGDTIQIKNSQLYRNGKKIKEPYIKEGMEDTEFPKTSIKKGELFVLGDNRNVSADSRIFGTFSVKQYIGKAELCIWKSWKIY